MGGIPCDDIDELCRPVIYFFNTIGLKTKYCCEGHPNSRIYYVMFEDEITDEKMFNFILRISPGNHTPIIGQFFKWARKCGDDLLVNWVYQINCGSHTKNQKVARHDYYKMIRFFPGFQEGAYKFV